MNSKLFWYLAGALASFSLLIIIGSYREKKRKIIKSHGPFYFKVKELIKEADKLLDTIKELEGL